MVGPRSPLPAAADVPRLLGFRGTRERFCRRQGTADGETSADGRRRRRRADGTAERRLWRARTAGRAAGHGLPAAAAARAV